MRKNPLQKNNGPSNGATLHSDIGGDLLILTIGGDPVILPTKRRPAKTQDMWTQVRWTHKSNNHDRWRPSNTHIWGHIWDGNRTQESDGSETLSQRIKGLGSGEHVDQL